MPIESSIPVPSTSSAPSLTIGFRRAELTAFWIVTCVLSSILIGLVALAVGARMPWAWAAIGLCLSLPGLVWRIWFEIGVRAWNKGVRLLTGALRRYVLRVCYYLLFAAVSRTGSSLDLRLGKAEVSRWVPRGCQKTGGDRAPQSGPIGTDIGTKHSVFAMTGSSRHTGHAWTVCLMPVMLLLKLLRDEERESAPPSATYTLY
jgi:hypothetical protein